MTLARSIDLLPACLRLSIGCILIGIVVFTQSACAHGNAIKVRDNPRTRELARRIGIPGCKLSEALTADKVIHQAHLDGVPTSSAVEARIKEDLESGADIYLVDCTMVDSDGVVEGTRFYAVVRNGKVEQQLLGNIYD